MVVELILNFEWLSLYYIAPQSSVKLEIYPEPPALIVPYKIRKFLLQSHWIYYKLIQNSRHVCIIKANNLMNFSHNKPVKNYYCEPVVVLHQFLWVSRKYEIAISFVKISVRSSAWAFFPHTFLFVLSNSHPQMRCRPPCKISAP